MLWTSSRCLTTSAKALFIGEDRHILGVRRNASREEIKAAYFQRAKELHPDSKNVNEFKDTFKFHELNEAYQRMMLDAAFRSNGEHFRHTANQKSRNLGQKGWYAGRDSRQSFFSETRVFFRTLNIAFRIVVLLSFGVIIVGQFINNLLYSSSSNR